MKSNFVITDNISNITKPDVSDYITDLTIFTNIYNSDKVIRGKNITIKGSLSSTNGAKVIIYATSITLEPGATISPDIQIIAVKDILEQESLEPVSAFL